MAAALRPGAWGALRSLGWRSEAMLVALDGQVRARRGYVALARPALPDDAWHNLLVMRRPPRRGDLGRWVVAFERELGGPRGTRHLAFGWDSPTGRLGALGPLREAGFAIVQCSVHVARSLPPPRQVADGVALRPLAGDADWAAAVALQAHGAPADLAGVDAFRDLALRRFARFRSLAEGGLGAVWGAFDAGRLVSACGIFGAEGLARYQAVVTHREHRGRGLAGRVLRAAGAWAGRALGARTMVITAELGSPAARLYGRIGLTAVEGMVGVVRPPG